MTNVLNDLVCFIFWTGGWLVSGCQHVFFFFHWSPRSLREVLDRLATRKKPAKRFLRINFESIMGDCVVCLASMMSSSTDRLWVKNKIYLFACNYSIARCRSDSRYWHLASGSLDGFEWIEWICANVIFHWLLFYDTKIYNMCLISQHQFKIYNFIIHNHADWLPVKRARTKYCSFKILVLRTPPMMTPQWLILQRFLFGPPKCNSLLLVSAWFASYNYFIMPGSMSAHLFSRIIWNDAPSYDSALQHKHLDSSYLCSLCVWASLAVLWTETPVYINIGYPRHHDQLSKHTQHICLAKRLCVCAI